jgi:hypothetical protein
MRQDTPDDTVRGGSIASDGGARGDPRPDTTAWPQQAAFEGWRATMDGTYRLGELSAEMLRRSAVLSFRGMELLLGDEPPDPGPITIDVGSSGGRLGDASGGPVGVSEGATARTSDPAVPPAGDAFDAFLATFEPDLPLHSAPSPTGGE